MNSSMWMNIVKVGLSCIPGIAEVVVPMCIKKVDMKIEDEEFNKKFLAAMQAYEAMKNLPTGEKSA